MLWCKGALCPVRPAGRPPPCAGDGDPSGQDLWRRPGPRGEAAHEGEGSTTRRAVGGASCRGWPRLLPAPLRCWIATPCLRLHPAQVSEARPLIEEQEAEKFVNSESVTREAISAVEQDGGQGGGQPGVWPRPPTCRVCRPAGGMPGSACVGRPAPRPVPPSATRTHGPWLAQWQFAICRRGAASPPRARPDPDHRHCVHRRDRQNCDQHRAPVRRRRERRGRAARPAPDHRGCAAGPAGSTGGLRAAVPRARAATSAAANGGMQAGAEPGGVLHRCNRGVCAAGRRAWLTAPVPSCWPLRPLPCRQHREHQARQREHRLHPVHLQVGCARSAAGPATARACLLAVCAQSLMRTRCECPTSTWLAPLLSRSVAHAGPCRPAPPCYRLWSRSCLARHLHTPRPPLPPQRRLPLLQAL